MRGVLRALHTWTAPLADHEHRNQLPLDMAGGTR